MSEEFIREVDEDLKEEKRLKLWKRMLPYVVSISLGVILSTSGFVFWENYTNKTKQQLGDDFTAAVELSNEEDIDAALLALDRIVDKGSDGYVTLSKMKQASLMIESGMLEEGLEIYKDLERNAVDQSFRDIATILFVLNFLYLLTSYQNLVDLELELFHLLVFALPQNKETSELQTYHQDLQQYIHKKVNEVEKK